MKISFSGDICIQEDIPMLSIADCVLNVYEQCDYNIACLEAPICDSKVLRPYIKEGPCLTQSNTISTFLKYFSHFDCANNHIMDYGYEGVSQTLQYLHNHGKVAVGVSNTYPTMYEPAILEKDGIKVALFCWAEAQYGCCKTEREVAGYAWLFNPRCYALIEEYKKKVDYVILYLHAGLEDEEIPLPEWRDQYKAYIDYGADLVIANHPHLIQGKEQYKTKWIYYSLGNLFINGWITQYASDSFWHSLVLQIEATKDSLHIQESFVSFKNSLISDASPHVKEHFNSMSTILTAENNTEYDRLYIEMIMRCWNDYYKSYYSYPIWKEKGPMVWWRRLFNRIMEPYVHHCFLPPVSLNKIYHNINIDTHRFVVAGVCSYLSNTY